VKKSFALVLLSILLLQLISMAWAFDVERPGGSLHIYQRTDSSYTTGKTSVGLGVSIDEYWDTVGAYGGKDCVRLNVSMLANSRIGIAYDSNWNSLWWIDEDDLSYRNEIVGLGDDSGVWISFPSPGGYPFYFRFYGGVGSAEYDRVWVCSNGYIVFDNYSALCYPHPQAIPNEAKPNALIAGVWTDLSIWTGSIITGLYEYMSHNYFVIIWKNAYHKASGKYLTFEIILEEAPLLFPLNRRLTQSQIWISYKSVSSINTYFTYGIENQQGAKGCGGCCYGAVLGSLNGYTLRFFQSSNSYCLNRLILEFQDANSQTDFDIVEEGDGYYLRGFNIKRNYNLPSNPDRTYMFAKAITSSAVLLITTAAAPPQGIVAGGGFILKTLLTTLDWAGILAYHQYSGRQVEVLDLQDNWHQKACATAWAYEYSVDASFDLYVAWILKTPNNVCHTLSINATAEYYEYSILTGEKVDQDITSTIVTIKVGPDDNNSFGKASLITKGVTYQGQIDDIYDASDYYKIYLNQGSEFYVYAWSKEVVPADPAPDFFISLYNPSGTHVISTSHGYSHQISYVATQTGYWFIGVHIYRNYGYYQMSVNLAGSGSGGCPFLYVFNGSEYICEGLLDIHNSQGIDVTVDHTLTAFPSSINNTYKFRLVEHPKTCSHIDQVKLYAVLENGLTIQIPLIWAWHSENGFVLPQLLLSDNWKTLTLGADWNNGTSQSISLRFLALPPSFNVKSFIFQIEGNNPYAK